MPASTRLAAVGAATALALLGGGATARAQARLEIGAGVTAWTEVIHDSITGPISIAMDPGFAAAFRVGTRLDSSNLLQIGLHLTRNTMVRQSEGTSSAITSVNVWFPSVSLTRHLAGPLSVRGTMGALVYDPDDRVGTPFRDGSPVLPVAGAGLNFAPGFTRGLSLDVSWDIHRFTTAALKSDGFGGDKVVHRLSVLVQLGGANAP